MENDNNGGGFHINVYSDGNNIAHTIYQNYYGSVYNGKASQEQSSQYTDVQIAQAIIAVSGSDKPLSLKRHFVGIICALQSMGWPRKFATCCTRINNLPGCEGYPVSCDSNAIKSTQLMPFASVDYKEWPQYKPKPGEENGLFNECKFAADSFMDALKMISQ